VYQKVLFVIPPFPGARRWYSGTPSYPHVGVGYLSEILDANDIENHVLDMRLGYDNGDLLRLIGLLRPDLVGVTTWTYGYKRIYELVSTICAKPHAQEYEVILGGPHTSTIGSKILSETCADFAVKLEGEHALLELCRGRPLSTIMGLIYRDDGTVVENHDRPFLRSLDDLPFPKYERFDLRKYARRIIPVVSSRGCPYSCIFCPVKATIGQIYRSRSARNVFEELFYWYSKGYREFSIQDDNFTLIKERVHEICDLIERNGLRNLSIICGNGIRADRVDRELLKRMHAVGFRELAFGVEAGNDRILSRIKKGESMQTIRRAIRDACDLGYVTTLTFMIGHPTETARDIEDSFRLALEFPVASATFFNIVPFPRTELYDWIETNRLFLRPPEQYLDSVGHWEIDPVFQTPELTYDERRRALLKGRKVSLLVRKRYAHRALKRYGVLGNVLVFFAYSHSFHRILGEFLQYQTAKKILLLFLRLTGLRYAVSFAPELVD